jgi:two-component system sensor histidine kinase VicK
VVNEENLQITSKKIKFKLDLGKNIPYISVDPKYIRMVVQNLLSNALKYTPVEGSIKVKLSQSKIEKKIIIEISDTGIGIPQSEQHKIFSKHFRAQNVQEKDDTQGTGLGLYLAKSIVDHSHGKIWFESQINKGTTFYVELPI